MRAVALSEPRLSNLSQDVEEVLSGFLKITQCAMVKRRSWVNIAVYPCLPLSLIHHRNINTFENKVWEIYFYKECVRSFIELHKSWVYNTDKDGEFSSSIIWKKAKKTKMILKRLLNDCINKYNLLHVVFLPDIAMIRILCIWNSLSIFLIHIQSHVWQKFCMRKSM